MNLFRVLILGTWLCASRSLFIVDKYMYMHVKWNAVTLHTPLLSESREPSKLFQPCSRALFILAICRTDINKTNWPRYSHTMCSSMDLSLNKENWIKKLWLTQSLLWIIMLWKRFLFHLSLDYLNKHDIMDFFITLLKAYSETEIIDWPKNHSDEVMWIMIRPSFTQKCWYRCIMINSWQIQVHCTKLTPADNT